MPRLTHYFMSETLQNGLAEMRLPRRVVVLAGISAGLFRQFENGRTADLELVAGQIAPDALDLLLHGLVLFRLVQRRHGKSLDGLFWL